MSFKNFIPGGSEWNTILAVRTFFVGVFSKWYFLITIPAVTITYKIYKKLEEKGVVDAFIEEIQKNLIVIEFIVDKCMDNILEFEKFYACIGSF